MHVDTLLSLSIRSDVWILSSSHSWNLEVLQGQNRRTRFWWWKIIIDSHNKKKDCMKLRISGNTNSMYLFYIWLFILGFPCANCHIVDMAIQEAIVTPPQLFFNLISTWKSHLWLWVVENEIHNLVRKLTKFYAALNNLNKASMFYLLLLARVYV